jgi:CTP synthase
VGEMDRALHPFFVATQAHPELKSRPTRPHPLFRAFVAAALAFDASDRLPVEIPDADVRTLPDSVDRGAGDAAGEKSKVEVA